MKASSVKTILPILSTGVKEVQGHYQKIAPKFRGRYSQSRSEEFFLFEDSIYDGLVNAQGKRVLDLGTGSGHQAHRLAGHAKQIIAVDISKAMIQLAHQEANSHKPILFAVSDGLKLPLRKGSLDVVLSAGMFEYIADPSSAFEEISRVLGLEGEFIFSCHPRLFPGTLQIVAVNLSRFLKKLGFKILGKKIETTEMNPHSKVYFSEKFLLQKLKLAGFDKISIRGTRIPPAPILYHSALPNPRLAFRLARWINHHLRNFPIWNRLGGVWIIACRKQKF